MLPFKILIRASLRLETAWQAGRLRSCWQEHAALERLKEHQHTLEQIHDQLNRAQSHDLDLAAASLRRQWLEQVNQVQEAADQALQRLQSPWPPVPVLATWIAELRQLERAFPGLQIDLRQKMLRVVTEPLLTVASRNPCAIQLHLDRLVRFCDHRCITVAALDRPSPLQKDEATSPQVFGELPGSGRVPCSFGETLRHGRLAEAFSLVRAIVKQGNPDSRSGRWCHDSRSLPWVTMEPIANTQAKHPHGTFHPSKGDSPR